MATDAWAGRKSRTRADDRSDFRINGKQTPSIGPGKTAALAVTFSKKGRYT
jgi:uncharacterized cupredoxin-like copper-binding protein